MYNYWAHDSSEALEHHGIKGQKWGEKHGPPYPIKYVDSDGNLTSEGRRRKRELAELDRNTTDGKIDISRPTSIKKGTTLTRVANAGEELDSKRKYVSLPGDTRTYLDFADSGDISINPEQSYGVYRYMAVKDLKMADYDTVQKFVLDNYGNTKLKDIAKTINTDPEGWKLYQHLSDNERSIYQSQFGRWAGLIKEVEKVHLNDITNHFKEEGYDIMSDFFDSVGIPTAMIVLNPKDSLELLSYKERKKK